MHIDYHVAFEHHWYSVPFTLIHQEVEIHASQHLIEIFHKGKLVAVHPRNYRQGRFTTQSEHMPENHRFVDHIDALYLTCKAQTIGVNTAALVKATLDSRRFPEQAYRTCLGILKLAKTYDRQLMEHACQSALETQSYSYKALKADLIHLSQKMDNLSEPEADPEPLPVHDNIRGADYYH